MQLLLNLDVPDLPSAVAFYQQALGFSVGHVLFDGTVVEMLGAAVPLYLLHKAAATRPCPEAGVQRDYRRHWTPLHLEWSLRIWVLHWHGHSLPARGRKVKSMNTTGGVW
jgi:catechol 2,3-dioxygenase-like lactoylglutathione lyase family enzyme